MKIIFMGTPDFAVGTLRSMAEAGHEITLVVSQPDKPKGRGHAMVPTPVKAVAEELGIPVFQPVKIREAKMCWRRRKQMCVWYRLLDRSFQRPFFI